MSLKIVSVTNGSTLEEEYVLLVATEAMNLKDYAVVDRTFDENGEVSNEFRHIFVFPSQQVSKDGQVRLYTGTRPTSRKLPTLSELMYGPYDFYWGSDKCVWNDRSGDTASLIKYTPIGSVTVPAIKS